MILDRTFHIELERTNENGLDETSYTQRELLRSIDRPGVPADTSLRVASVVKTLLDYGPEVAGRGQQTPKKGLQWFRCGPEVVHRR